MRAEEPELGHARDERPREFLAGVAGRDERRRLALDEAAHGGARETLLLAQELVEAVVVDVVARGHGILRRHPVARAGGGPYKMVSRQTKPCISHAPRDAQGLLRRRRDAQLLHRRIAEFRHAVGGESTDSDARGALRAPPAR